MRKRQMTLSKLRQSKKTLWDYVAIAWFVLLIWPLIGLVALTNYTAKVYMKLMDRVIDIKLVNKLFTTEAHLLTENGVVVFRQNRFRALLNKFKDWRASKS